MFRIFRPQRVEALNKKHLTRYLRYSTGEILLVVIGILIALQIDNWNNDRQEAATLDSYLSSIARNVKSDIAEMRSLRVRRQDNLLNTTRVQPIVRKNGGYEVKDVFAFSRTVDYALRSLYFIPDTSGYEALKSSGVLDRLQGREIEKAISDYYDLLSKIQRLESEYNNSLQSLGALFDLDIPEDFGSWVFYDPSALQPDEFLELQPYFRGVIRGASARKLFDLQINESSKILLEYKQAISTGEKLIQLVGAASVPASDEEEQTDNLAVSNSNLGNPELVIDGAISFDSYTFNVTSSNNLGQEFTSDFVDRREDALYLSYPGSDPAPGVESWAAIWFSVNDTAFGRPSRSFSSYDTLQLELKGSLGGERLLLHMKDKDDLDDGSQTNIELILTDQWTTYDIDLVRFENADLNTLSIVTGFLLLQQFEPISFLVRNVRFTSKEVH